jgi:hypothetical protein
VESRLRLAERGIRTLEKLPPNQVTTAQGCFLLPASPYLDARDRTAVMIVAQIEFGGPCWESWRHCRELRSGWPLTKG